jgi:hypothetical protein
MPLAFTSGMKKTLVLAISVLVMAAPLAAQRGGGSPKPPTSHGASAPKAPKTTTHAAPKTTVHSSPVKVAQAPKAAKPLKTTTKSTTMKPAKATKTTTTTKPAKTTKATTTTVTTTTTTLSPVQLKLQKNTNLATKLQSRLPAGTDLTLAAAGFRNLGQFVAAVNVSNNLGIPFLQLKTRMVDQGMSLGQAIQDTRGGTTDTTVVVRRAETDADVLIRTTEQTTKAKNKKVAKRTSGLK